MCGGFFVLPQYTFHTAQWPAAPADRSLPKASDGSVARAVSARRFPLQVLGGFGGTALLLAGLAIYGVLAYSVAERRADIGIRMALGASAGLVLKSVIGRTVLLASIGIALGLMVSLGVARLLSSLLFEVGTTDPVTLAGMTTMLLLVALFAGAVPARRAARLNGVRALRSEKPAQGRPVTESAEPRSRCGGRSP